jgi:hypothetical protein
MYTSTLKTYDFTYVFVVLCNKQTSISQYALVQFDFLILLMISRYNFR